jgi:hypothetical protein
MFNADWGYDPFQAKKTPAYWKLDKPTIIGECPAQAGDYTVQQMVDSAYAHGYAGIMPWSYNANDGVGTWETCKNQLKAFHDAHSALVDFNCSSAVLKNDGRNPAKSQWTLAALLGQRGLPSGMKVKMYDMQGRLVLTRQAGAAARTAVFPLKGAFLYQLIDGNEKIIYTGESVK